MVPFSKSMHDFESLSWWQFFGALKLWSSDIIEVKVCNQQWLQDLNNQLNRYKSVSMTTQCFFFCWQIVTLSCKKSLKLQKMSFHPLCTAYLIQGYNGNNFEGVGSLLFLLHFSQFQSVWRLIFLDVSNA